MHRHQLIAKGAAAALFVAATAVFGACSSDASKPINNNPIGTGAGSGGSGSGGASCGNDFVDPGEACDGTDVAGATCEALGLPTGTIGCTLDCTIDTSECRGPEACFDGLDNDVDGDLDCVDADCAAACGSSCAEAAVIPLPDPSSAAGSTLTHPNDAKLNATCASAAGSGPEIVYRVTAAETGVLSVILVSTANLGVSVRTTCDAVGSELDCADIRSGTDAQERLLIPITAGDTAFVVVQGYAATDSGSYILEVHSRPIVCGDGNADGTEECDDGNLEPADGCTDTCVLEATEVEPNDTTDDAEEFVAPWFAAISPAKDVDFVKVVLTGASSVITATTRALDPTSCVAGVVDTVVEIIGVDGTTVVATGDDEYGTCAIAQAAGLFAGTYYVRVAAATLASDLSFAYALDVTVVEELCGDNAVTGAEQCDDGNALPGDGCDAVCQFELTESEPNSSSGKADEYVAVWHAAISPAEDVDVVSFYVPFNGSSLAAQVLGYGADDCMGSNIISQLDILDKDGTTVLVSSTGIPGNYCASAEIANLGAFGAGTYFVRVSAGPLAMGATETFSYSLAIMSAQ